VSFHSFLIKPFNNWLTFPENTSFLSLDSNKASVKGFFQFSYTSYSSSCKSKQKGINNIFSDSISVSQGLVIK
jgi:hypothetical protein